MHKLKLNAGNEMFSRLKYIFLFLVVVVGFYSYSYFSYVQDFKLVVGDMNGKGAGLVFGPKEIPSCCKLSKVSEKVVSISNQTSFSPIGKDEILKSVDAAEVASCKPFLTEGYDNYIKQIKLPGFSAKLPEKIDVAKGTYNYRLIRETARIFGFLGRYYSVSGDSSMAIRAVLSCATLSTAPLLNKPERCSLIGYMIAISTLKIAGQSLIDISKEISPNKKVVKVVFDSFKKLKEQLPSLFFVSQMEKKAVTSMDYPYELQKELLKKKGVSNPAERLKPVMEFMKELYKQKVDNDLIYLEKPFYVGIEKIKELEDRMRLFQEKYFGPFKNPGIFDLLFPAKILAKVLFQFSFPNYKNAYIKQNEAFQILEGGVAVLALYAYKNEKGSFPDDLDALDKWLGFEVSGDHFSGKKLLYKNSPLELFSVGVDLKAGTSDDFMLLPDYKR